MELAEAKKIAEKYMGLFSPYCIRIEIAGSIRREKPEVKDVELVVIPDRYWLEKYFVENAREFKFTKNGSKYKQLLLHEGIKLDLFIANEKTFPMIYLIRTGSANFSHQLMIDITRKGYRCQDGILYKVVEGIGLEEVPRIEEERDVFKVLGLKWIEPINRN